MTADNTAMEEFISTLKQHRDELQLKIHLATAEGKAEWEKATQKLDDLLLKSKSLKDAVGESANELTASLKLVGDEIQNSFNRIRKTF